MDQSKILCAFLFAITFISCSKGKSLRIPRISTDFIQENTAKLESDFFLIGPSIDSVNAEISAGCDCCASDLTFLNDSSFVYIELCLGGDSYIKGNYLVFGNLLILHTDEEIISSEYEYAVESVGDSPTMYEVTQQKRAYHAYTISTLKGKQVITYNKDDYTEYGMPTHGSFKSFLDEFRKEQVLRRFLEAE